jgi:hypothetical protein
VRRQGWAAGRPLNTCSSSSAVEDVERSKLRVRTWPEGGGRRRARLGFGSARRRLVFENAHQRGAAAAAAVPEAADARVRAGDEGLARGPATSGRGG